MTLYLLYRHGSNRANQASARLPVAIVEAKSQAEATATVRHDPPGRLDPYLPATSVLAPEVDVWANQTLVAIPVSRAPRADVRTVEEARAE